MKGLVLVLADFDSECIEALSEYFSQYNKREFSRVIGFENAEKLSTYLESNKIDVLLCSIEMYKMIKEQHSIKTKIFFKTNAIEPEYEKDFFIDATDQAKQISEDILKAYAMSNPTEKVSLNHTTSTKLIAVYSPVGGVGKTSVSIGLCKALADQKLPTLYLCFDVSPFLEKTALNFTDLICEAVKEQSNVANIGIAAQIKDESGFYYFTSPTAMTDSEDMTPAQALKLINMLKNSGNYQRIIIDLSSAFNQVNRDVIASADQVVLVSNNQKDSFKRMEIFENNINLLDGRSVEKESFLRKTIFVINENFYTKESISSNRVFAGSKAASIFPFDSKIASTGHMVHNYKFADFMRLFVEKYQL